MEKVLGGIVSVAVVFGGYFIGEKIFGTFEAGAIGAGVAFFAFLAIVSKITSGRY